MKNQEKKQEKTEPKHSAALHETCNPKPEIPAALSARQPLNSGIQDAARQIRI